MTKSSQKKVNNYFCNLHTLKSKEKHPCARAAHASLGSGGRGAPAVRQSGTRAMAHVRAPGPWCPGGAPAARQICAYIPCLRWAGGLRWCVRAARVPLLD